MLKDAEIEILKNLLWRLERSHLAYFDEREVLNKVIENEQKPTSRNNETSNGEQSASR